MAKHCISCNETYSDDLAACPHCGVPTPPAPVGPGSSPDIILGDQALVEASDSDLVPVITSDGSSATHFDRLEGSSMDIDLGQSNPGDSSALIVAAAEQGSPSDVMDVDFSSVADPSSTSQPPLVAPEAKATAQPTALAMPDADAGDDTSGLTVGEANVLAGFGSGSSLEIETAPEPAAEQAAASDGPVSDSSAEVLGHEVMTTAGEASDSSAVDLGSYRDEKAEGEEAAAGTSSSWSSLKEGGVAVPIVTPAQPDEAAAASRSSRGWLGGGVVGVAAGAAACLALWSFGIEPPQALRGLVGKKKTPVAQVQPVSSGQPTQREPARAVDVEPRQTPGKPVKTASDETLDRVAKVLRADADVQKQDPQLKKVDQDIQVVVQGKQKALAELDAVRKAVSELKPGATTSLAAAVSQAQEKARRLEKDLAAVGRTLKLKGADEPVAPAVEKLLADQETARKQLARLTRQAEGDRAQLQAIVQRLTTAKILPAGAGADKVLASMDRLLVQGPSPVATALVGVAAGLGEVGGAATSSAGTVVHTTGTLTVSGLHNALTALAGAHRSGVVTTTALHQPTGDTPALHLPQSLGVYQPEAAEKHFSAGCQSYWSGDPEHAVREFQAAIHSNHDDARYHYFLGLTLLQQQRPGDAVPIIRQGALLEKQGLPDPGAVNVALERIQGSTRELLDRYRR